MLVQLAVSGSAAHHSTAAAGHSPLHRERQNEALEGEKLGLARIVFLMTTILLCFAHNALVPCGEGRWEKWAPHGDMGQDHLGDYLK